MDPEAPPQPSRATEALSSQGIGSPAAASSAAADVPEASEQLRLGAPPEAAEALAATRSGDSGADIRQQYSTAFPATAAAAALLLRPDGSLLKEATPPQQPNAADRDGTSPQPHLQPQPQSQSQPQRPLQPQPENASPASPASDLVPRQEASCQPQQQQQLQPPQLQGRRPVLEVPPSSPFQFLMGGTPSSAACSTPSSTRRGSGHEGADTQAAVTPGFGSLLGEGRPAEVRSTFRHICWTYIQTIRPQFCRRSEPPCLVV